MVVCGGWFESVCLYSVWVLLWWLVLMCWIVSVSSVLIGGVVLAMG